MMGEVFLETPPKNIMIQDMINSENSTNTTWIDKHKHIQDCTTLLFIWEL